DGRNPEGHAMERERMQIERGTVVEASDGQTGTVEDVVVGAHNRDLAYLVVRLEGGERLFVPLDRVETGADARRVRLRETFDRLRAAGGPFGAERGARTT